MAESSPSWSPGLSGEKEAETTEDVPVIPRTHDTSLLVHFPHVVDIDTGGPVTRRTQLASIYQFDVPSVGHTTLENINDSSRSRIRAQMHIEPSQYPPTLDESHGYSLFVSFNTLLYAPAVRVECHFDTLGLEDTVLALEYSFNRRRSKQLRNFSCTANSELDGRAVVCFEANGATLEGFTQFPQFQNSLTQTQKAFVDAAILQASSEGWSRIKLLSPGEPRDLPQAFNDALSRLPGGDGVLLLSIGTQDWGSFLDPSMSEANFHLQQQCRHSFTTIDHFRAEHWTSENIANTEGHSKLRKWARLPHKVAMYAVKGHILLAMIFGNTDDSEVDGKKEKLFKLPDDLEIVIRLHGIHGHVFTACYERDVMGVQHHVHHDAYFKVTSHRLKDHKRLCHQPEEENPHYRAVFSLQPHYNRFWITSVSETCEALVEATRWHPILLGQSTDPLKEVDLLSSFESESNARKSKAKQWLADFPWNSEQQRVIEGVHWAPEGMVLFTGIRGTGKTTLLLRSAVYMAMLGGSSILSASENANAEILCLGLMELIQHLDIRAYFIQSASRRARLRNTNAAQAMFKKVGHQDRRAAGFNDYKFAMLSDEHDRNATWKYSLGYAVAKEAEIGKLKCHEQLRPGKGEPYGPFVDIFAKLRELKKLDDAGKIDWESQEAPDVAKRIQYEHTYNACEAYLIAHADIVVTTHANARCKELLRRWGSSDRPCGVFLDEADSSREMESWNVITSCVRSPDLVMLCGDVQQIGPINTSVNHDILCNPFAYRLSMSLLDRLIRLGFPHISLTEQRAMNSVLLDFPNREFYGNKLTTAPGSDKVLQPLLKATLQLVLAGFISDPEKQADFLREEMSDERGRLCYIDLGTLSTVEKDARKSVVVPACVEVFFSEILLPLQECFGNRTSKEVIVMVAYSYARTIYTECMHSLQEEQGKDDTFYPRILSVDGSKGHIATFAFFDGSMQRSDRLGFLGVPNRCNVAMTRATEVFWIIGGSLWADRFDFNSSGSTDTPFPNLRRELQSKGQLWHHSPSDLSTVTRLRASHKDSRPYIRDTRNAGLRKQTRYSRNAATFRSAATSTASRAAFVGSPQSVIKLPFHSKTQTTPAAGRAAPSSRSQSIIDASESPRADERQYILGSASQKSPENHQSERSDEHRFLAVASRVRGGADVPRGTSKASVTGVEVHEQIVQDDLGKEAFMALAQRLRGGKL